MVRIISVTLVQRDLVIGNNRVGGRIHNSVVFHPLVGDGRTNIGGIQVSSQRDVVASGVTHDRIGNEHHNRIRVNRDGSKLIIDIGLTTSSRLSDRHSVVVSGGLTVKSAHNLAVSSGGSAFDDLTITIPSVNLTASNTAGHGGRQVNLITVANSVLISSVVDHNRRISINRHNDGVRGSVTERSQLVDLDVVLVNTFSRNNRVAQLSSTRNHGRAIIPLVGKLISIPVIQSSRNRDLTTVTNVGLSSRDVHNRSSVHIDGSVSVCNTAVFVDQFNGEAVRIISVRFGEVIHTVSSSGNNSVVFHPLVGDRSSRHRIDVSVKHNIAVALGANDRIGHKFKRRIRVHRDGVDEVNFRFATRSGLTNLHRINVLSGLVINSGRSVNKHIAVDVEDFLTVTIPSVVLAASDTTGGGSLHSNRSAFADGLLTIEIVNSRDNGDRIHEDLEGVVCNTVLSVEVHQVRDFDNVVGSTENRLEGFNLMSSTRQNVGVVHLVLIPLISQHRIVVVIKVGAHRDITAFADRVSISSDVRVRSSIHVHFERIRNRRTTITIGHFNREDVGVVIGRLPSLKIVVVITIGVGSVLTILIPLVSSVGIKVTVNPSGQDNVIVGRSEVAVVMVTLNRNDRVTFHMNRIGSNRNQFTTRDVINDVSSVGVINRIAVIDVGLSAERRTMDGLQLHAVQLPHVGERAVNISFINGMAISIHGIRTVSSNQRDRIAGSIKFKDVSGNV